VLAAAFCLVSVAGVFAIAAVTAPSRPSGWFFASLIVGLFGYVAIMFAMARFVFEPMYRPVRRMIRRLG
jgi:hypothetical protein